VPSLIGHWPIEALSLPRQSTNARVRAAQRLECVIDRPSVSTILTRIWRAPHAAEVGSCGSSRGWRAFSG
jgi:hypothetical protein